jgi:hypothetical protein
MAVSEGIGMFTGLPHATFGQSVDAIESLMVVIDQDKRDTLLT